MHRLLAFALCVSCALPLHAKVPVSDHEAEQFAAECIRSQQRTARELGHYPLEFRADGSVRTSAATWTTLTGPEQILTLWMAAWTATCAKDERRLTEVRVVNRAGQVLRRQLVSTTLECHGDIVGNHGEPWYLC